MLIFAILQHVLDIKCFSKIALMLNEIIKITKLINDKMTKGHR